MMIIALLLFLVLPFLLAIILPLILSVWLAKRFFGKGITWKSLSPFILSVVGFSALVNLVWNYFVFNKIYYEWDRVLFTPFTLLLHESPVIDSSVSWIAQGWTLNKLHLLFGGLLALVYFLSFIFAYLWFVKTKKRHPKEVNSFTKVLGISIIILLMLPLLWYKGTSLLGAVIENRLYPPRVENPTACVQPTEKDRVYFGGSQADYISSGDGSNVRKIWDKPHASGIAFGSPSPDNSKLLHFDNYNIWIRCTVGEGQYKIPLDKKVFSNLPVDIYVNSLTWSPDSTYVAFNYGGDLIKVNTVTKEKTIIYPNVAFKNYGVDPKGPRPSGWFGPFYTQGNVYWAKDGSLYYSKFLENDKVELRRLDNSGKDTLVFTSLYPLFISNETKEGKLLIYESDWSAPGRQSSHSEGFVYNPKNRQKEDTFYGYKLKDGDTHFSYKVSGDGRYLLTNTGFTGQISPAPVFWLFDLSNNQQINVQDKIRNYLKEQGITDSTERIALIDISPNNDLLFYVYFDNAHPSMTLSSDIKGDNIKLIFQDDKNSNKNPAWLIPHSWL